MEKTSKILKDRTKLNFDGIKYLSVMYHDLGMFYLSKQEFEKALNFFQEASDHLEVVYNEVSSRAGMDAIIIDDLKEQMKAIKQKIAEINDRLIKRENKAALDIIEKYKNHLYSSVDDYSVFSTIGNALLDIGAHSSAILFINKSLSMNPNNYDGYRMLGDIYAHNKKDPMKAIVCYEKYLEFVPSNGLVYNMLGHLYEYVDKYRNIEKQLAYFEKAVELMPDFKCSIKNVALVAPRIAQYEKSIKYYHRLFELGPSYDDYFDYACLKIHLGDFEEGWKYYEHRFKKENGHTPYPTEIKKPKWDGTPILDSTLLVQYEQGFGDSMQFFRYLPQIKPLAKKIIFRVQDGLVDLFKINDSDMEIVGMKTPVEALQYDYHVPLMSLPYLLKATKENIPLSEGFLKADSQKIQSFKKDFFDNDCFKIGISWNGSKDGNARRNIPLEAFIPLTKLKNVKIYSFQKGFGSEQLQNLPDGIEIVDLGNKFDDFSDTAAAMANLDLFVSSDNGVFNLAGCMGVRAFLLLSKDAEWRWFQDTEKTPWYDSVRIFKKEDENDSWDTLMARVVDVIDSELGSK